MIKITYTEYIPSSTSLHKLKMASFVTKAFQKAVLIHSKYASAGTVRKKPQSSHFYLLATTKKGYE